MPRTQGLRHYEGGVYKRDTMIITTFVISSKNFNMRKEILWKMRRKLREADGVRRHKMR